MTNPNAQDSDDEIDLFQLLQIVVEGKLVILAVTISFLVAGIAAALTMTPKYEIRVVASFADEGKSSSNGLSALAGQFGSLAEISGINLGSGGGSRENSLAFLKSRAFLEKFIEDEGLIAVLYSAQWDVAGKRWRTEPPSLWRAYELFSKKILNVQSDKKTGLITLTITWRDRYQAVTWANELLRRANAALREKSIAETRLSISYLEKELAKTSVVEVQNTVFRVMESQIKTMMMANTQEQFAFKVIDPAQVVDEDAFVSPKRPLIVALSCISGLFSGLLLVFLRRAWRNRIERMPKTEGAGTPNKTHGLAENIV